VSSLFSDHIERQQRLDDLAETLRGMSSLIGLHGWYQSNNVLLEAADLAEEAAAILIGERIAAYEQRGRVDPTPAGTAGIAPAGDLNHEGDRHG
jgi:hypothetical protein